MEFFGKHWKLLAASLVLAGGLFGCGAASNDQGVSFSLMGYYAGLTSDPLDCTKSPLGVSAISAPLSQASTEDGQTDSGVWVFIGLSNNITTQSLRTQRVYFSYYIPGSSVQPPSTSTALTLTLPALVPTTSGGTDGVKTCNRAYAGVAVVPAEVRTWLNFHRQYLPEPPFSMIVTTTVEAISSAGDGYTSNDADLNINWLPDNPIGPNPTPTPDTSVAEFF